MCVRVRTRCNSGAEFRELGRSGISRNYIFYYYSIISNLFSYHTIPVRNSGIGRSSGIRWNSEIGRNSGIERNSRIEKNSVWNEFRNSGNRFRNGINSRNVQHCGIGCILSLASFFHFLKNCTLETNIHLLHCVVNLSITC